MRCSKAGMARLTAVETLVHVTLVCIDEVRCLADVFYRVVIGNGSRKTLTYVRDAHLWSEVLVFERVEFTVDVVARVGTSGRVSSPCVWRLQEENFYDFAAILICWRCPTVVWAS